jgi:hypothetical protein
MEIVLKKIHYEVHYSRSRSNLCHILCLGEVHPWSPGLLRWESVLRFCLSPLSLVIIRFALNSDNNC